MLASGAIHFDEVALSEILDPSGVKGEHERAPLFLECSMRARGRGRVNGDYADGIRRYGRLNATE